MKFAKFAMLLAALASFSFAEWDGSSKEPEKVNKVYEVTTPEELIWVLDHCYFPDSWNLANDIVFGKDTASLSPIVWNVQEHSNCDRNNLNLYSSFDGNNHTIYGINSHQSLFAYISAFKNLTIANSQFGGFDIDSVAPLALTAEGQLKNIEIRNTKIMAAKYAAGVAVENKFYVIPNDKTGGFKLDTVTSAQDIRVIGGSVESMGHAAGIFNVNNLAATNLYNSSSVTVIDTSTDCLGYQTDKIAAGLIGQMDIYYASYNSSLESISNSVNEGDVKVISKCGNVYAGGIAATSNGVFRYVENKGNIYGKTTTSTTYAGGILGHQDKTKLGYYFNNKKLSNKGDVYGESSLYDYVGGIYGYTTGNALDSAFNEGSITGVATGKDSSYANVGGIIGYAIRLSSYGHFANLGNWGKIKGSSEKFVAAAGVIGRFGSPSNYPSSALLAALNYGDVDAHITARSTYDAQLYAAGITAYSEFAPTYSVYNYGNITGDTDIENSLVAGIMAYAPATTDYAVNSYNVASKIVGKKVGAINADGPCSRYDFKNSFNDMDVNPMTILVDTSAVTEQMFLDQNVRNLTTEELQSDSMLYMLNSHENRFYDKVFWIKGSSGYPVFLFDTTGGNSFKAITDIKGWTGKSQSVDPDYYDGKYHLKTPENLIWFIHYSKYIDDAVGVIDNDIYFGKDSSSLFEVSAPINKDTVPFQGKLQGQGHTIYGLNATTPLFNTIASSGVVNNLHIANSAFQGDSIGAIAGTLYGTLVNCSIRNSTVKGDQLAGGLAAAQYPSGGMISGSKNINTTVTGKIAGGIVGYSEQNINGSTNSGHVIGSMMAGGIAGEIYDNMVISGNSNAGLVEAKGEGPVFAGGIVGHLQKSVIHENNNTGDVSAESETAAAFAGGIAGVHYAPVNIVGTPVIQYSGNWGNISAKAPMETYVGGVVALAQADSGSVTVVTNDFNYGKITANATSDTTKIYAGGIVGKALNSKTEVVYNRGEIASDKQENAGGLVGMLKGGYVKNGYSAADVNSGTPVIGSSENSDTLASLFYDKSFKASAADKNAIGMTTEDMSKDSFLNELKQSSDSEKSWIAGNTYPIFGIDTTKASQAVVDTTTIKIQPKICGKGRALQGQFTVTVSGHDVTLMNAKGVVSVLDLQGNTVTRVNTTMGTAQFQIPTAGRYILKDGFSIKRVTIR